MLKIIQVVNCGYSEKFKKYGLPKIFLSIIKLNLNKDQSAKNILELSGLDIDSFIKILSKSLVINSSESSYTLLINDAVKIKDFTLSSLIRYIDYGNSSSRSSNIFNNAIKYINDNIELIYMIWLSKGGKNVS